MLVAMLPLLVLGASPLAQSRVLEASSNVPVASMSWVGVTRGRMALQIPIIGELDRGEGLALTLVPLLEVFGEDVPEDNWRGRAALELSWRFASVGRLAGEASLALEHESDHVTNWAVLVPQPSGALIEAPPPAAVYNDVALRGALAITDLAGAVVVLAAVARLHFSSCTDEGTICYVGTEGNAGLELEAGIVVDWSTGPSAAPFVSAHAGRLLARGLLVAEQVLRARAGLSLGGEQGRWQIFLEGHSGTSVGATRSDQSNDLGGGVAWSW